MMIQGLWIPLWKSGSRLSCGIYQNWNQARTKSSLKWPVAESAIPTSVSPDGVRTRHALPLVLGHEIAGRVVAAGDKATHGWDAPVIVPAVIACGECAAAAPALRPFAGGSSCRATMATAVLLRMCAFPRAGFAAFRTAACRRLARVLVCGGRCGDAPYEAIRRSGLKADEVAVFVGAGGIGGFAVQIAAALGRQGRRNRYRFGASGLAAAITEHR